MPLKNATGLLFKNKLWDQLLISFNKNMATSRLFNISQWTNRSWTNRYMGIINNMQSIRNEI